jgi:hypothetical protein
MDGHRPRVLELDKGRSLVQVTRKRRISRHSLKNLAEILSWHRTLARGWLVVAEFSTILPMVGWRAAHPSVVANISQKL